MSRRLPITLVLGCLLAPACNRVEPPAAPASTSAFDPLDLKAICTALTTGDNSYFGTSQLDAIQKQLQSTPASADPIATADLLAALAHHQLRLGRVEESIASLKTAHAALAAHPAQRQAADRVLLRLAIAELRLAEVRNCIEAHCPASCIFPLDAAAAHTRRDASAAAAKHLAEYLDRGPHPPSDHYTAVWLLNIAHMTLGAWPDALPEKLRLPPQSFASPHDVGRFTDVASRVGLDVVSVSGGAVVDDFDNDGLLDVVTSSAEPCRPLTFHRNLGDGRFEDRADAAGLADQLGGLNLSHADFDNDGLLDLLVLRGAWLGADGRQRVSLLHNQGDGTFTDVTLAAGLAASNEPTLAAAWADFDLDGHLDLFLARETGLPPGSTGDPGPAAHFRSALFRNNGDGTFTDVAAAAGVTNDRYARGAAWGDFDDDGWPDLYVSNLGQPNRLYRNRGDGTFEDVAAAAGVEQHLHSFATWFFDYDNDGRLDLFAAAYAGDVGMYCAEQFGLARHVRADRMRLYRNLGNGRFADVTREAGLYRLAFAMGANFGDIDNDGWLDFYLGTGYPAFEAIMPNRLFRNDRGQRFQDVTTSAGVGHLQKGHGIAFADIDNDGDQDIFAHIGGMFPGDAYANALFLNPGHGRHWLTIRLVGTTTNRFGIGARLTLTIRDPGHAERGPPASAVPADDENLSLTNSDREGEAPAEPRSVRRPAGRRTPSPTDASAPLRTIHRQVGSGGSFGSSPYRQEIGLGRATEVQLLEIYWPASRATQRLEHIPADRAIEITEGRPGYRPLPAPRLPL